MRTLNCFFYFPPAADPAGRRRSRSAGRYRAILLVSALCAATVSCGLPVAVFPPRGDGGAARVSVMSWNLQCFFDAVECGTEYSEFRGAGWTAEKYEARLDRLREVLLYCGKTAGEGSDRGPDIAVFQEIENGDAVRDLCNRLPRRCGYRSAVFIPPEPGGAFGMAVLSRFPADGLTVHSISPSDSPLRPLGELSLRVGNRRLVVFAVHWKSNSGDQERARSLRLRQEEALAARIERLEGADSASAFLACGDFNQGRDSFSLIAAADGWDGFTRGGDTVPDGSYWYRGSWERIDHIWFGHGARAVSFGPIAASPFADDGCVPVRYEAWSGRGYSDHLPVLAVVEF